VSKLNCVNGIHFIHFHAVFLLRGVAGAAALGGLGIPHDQQQFQNWRPITDTLTLNGFTRMQSMVRTVGNSRIWLGTPPVVLQFILVFFHFVVCIASSRNILILIPTLGK